MPSYVLNDRDVKVLRTLIDRERKAPRNTTGRPGEADNLMPGSEVYVALIPETGIPGRNTTTIYGEPCDIYRVLFGGGVTWTLMEAGFQRQVLNLSETEAEPGSIVLIHKDKFGAWWIGGSGGADGTVHVTITGVKDHDYYPCTVDVLDPTDDTWESETFAARCRAPNGEALTVGLRYLAQYYGPPADIDNLGTGVGPGTATARVYVTQAITGNTTITGNNTDYVGRLSNSTNAVVQNCTGGTLQDHVPTINLFLGNTGWALPANQPLAFGNNPANLPQQIPFPIGPGTRELWGVITTLAQELEGIKSLLRNVNVGYYGNLTAIGAVTNRSNFSHSILSHANVTIRDAVSQTYSVEAWSGNHATANALPGVGNAGSAHAGESFYDTGSLRTGLGLVTLPLNANNTPSGTGTSVSGLVLGVDVRSGVNSTSPVVFGNGGVGYSSTSVGNPSSLSNETIETVHWGISLGNGINGERWTSGGTTKLRVTPGGFSANPGTISPPAPSGYAPCMFDTPPFSLPFLSNTSFWNGGTTNGAYWTDPGIDADWSSFFLAVYSQKNVSYSSDNGIAWLRDRYILDRVYGPSMGAPDANHGGRPWVNGAVLRWMDQDWSGLQPAQSDNLARGVDFVRPPHESVDGTGPWIYTHGITDNPYPPEDYPWTDAEKLDGIIANLAAIGGYTGSVLVADILAATSVNFVNGRYTGLTP